jgi:hypothetical protein
MNLTETFNTSEDVIMQMFFVCKDEPTEELQFAHEVSFSGFSKIAFIYFNLGLLLDC